MDSVVLIRLQFGLCAGLIGVAGVRLGRYRDALAQLTGNSRSLVDLIFLATVTSLLELVMCLCAVAVTSAPEIAEGDNVIGSCVFNLVVLAMIEVTYRNGSIYVLAGSGNIASARFGVILLTGVCLALLLNTQGKMPTIGHVSLAIVMIFVRYLVAIRALYLTEQRSSSLVLDKQPDMTFKAALTGYGLASAMIACAGIWLPIVGVGLVRLMGWSNSFVGRHFVAFATSVPELTTTWDAIRIGAIDMAIGNLLGSNLFEEFTIEKMQRTAE